MKRLGYDRFLAQGGDWGALMTEIIGVMAPPELVAIHTNMPSTVPPEIFQALRDNNGPPAGLSDEERRAYERLEVFFYHGLAYANQMGHRPQTLYGIADSPIGLAAWFLDHDISSYQMIARAFDGEPEGLSRDDVLDNITITWLTNTAISGARLYWEAMPRTSSGFGIEKNNVHFFEPFGVTSSDRGDPVPRRALPGAAQLGGTGLSEAHPLRPEAQGRAFRRLRAARSSWWTSCGPRSVGAVEGPCDGQGPPWRPPSPGRVGGGIAAPRTAAAVRARRAPTSSATTSASQGAKCCRRGSISRRDRRFRGTSIRARRSSM